MMGWAVIYTTGRGMAGYAPWVQRNGLRIAPLSRREGCALARPRGTFLGACVALQHLPFHDTAWPSRWQRVSAVWLWQGTTSVDAGETALGRIRWARHGARPMDVRVLVCICRGS